MKLISIAIPMFNAELYLDDCLASVVNQGFTDDEIEIILIDDGSQDATKLIAQRWASKHPSIRLYEQEPHGISYTRNRALGLAQGKYFAFIDADDIAADGVYRRLIDKLESTGSDFATGPVFRFSTGRKKAWLFTRSGDLFDHPADRLSLKENPQFVRDFMLWNKLFRRDFLVNAGLEFPVGMIYEDIATTPKLYELSTSFDVVGYPVVYWRMSRGTITTTIRPEKALDRLTILADLRAHFRDADLRLVDELDFAILDYNLRWVYQEYHKYDDATQQAILDQCHTLTKDMRRSVVARTPEPLDGWVRLSQAGKHRALAEQLEQKPTVANQRVGESTPLVEQQKDAGKRARKHKRAFMRFTMKRRVRHVMLYLVFRPLVFLFPVDHKRAMFSNYWGNKFSLSDGPAAIAAELSKTDPTYKLVVVSSPHRYEEIKWAAGEILDPRAKVVVVKNHSFAYFYQLWRSKYLFNDVNFSIGFNVDRFVAKRPGQVEVQTTHGTPLKKMGVDSDSAISAEEMPKFLAKSQRYDYLVSPSPLVARTFAASHAVNVEILKTGLPQNDVLFETPKPSEIADIKAKYGLDPAKKLIVYAPTYRYGRGYAFRYALDFEKLHEQLGDDYQVAIKIHPFAHTNVDRIHFRHLTDWAVGASPSRQPFIKLFGSVHEERPYLPVYEIPPDPPVEVTKSNVHADINELMLAADVLITDYSSIIFNYPHLNKPLILFVPDAEMYERDRGMYFDLKQNSPGPFVQDMETLITALEHSADEQTWLSQYGERIGAFKHSFNEWETGDASAKVLAALGMIGSSEASSRNA